MYKSLQYLDSIVGLHTGISTYYCDNDNNLRISNLTTRMRKAQTFTINHLAQNNDNTEIINKSLDGKSFYTYDNIDTNYKGNSVFSVLSKNMKHIVKPRDTLYHIIERDLEEVCSEEGLISKNKKIHIDDNISDRTKYYINHNGYDETETFISVAKQISSLSNVSINLERNLAVLSLSNVGESVKLNTHVSEFLNLTGKYILKSSDIVLYKEGEWQTTCRINLIRTNKTI